MRILNFTFIALTLILTNCGGGETGAMPSDLLKYSIHNEEVYDAPIKTEVSIDVLIEDVNINEEGIKTLLNYLYKTTKERSGFKHNEHPNSIYIYAFTTKEKAASGMGQWIGMISKSASDKNPKINFSEIQLNSLSVNIENRWGLSQDKREELWKEIVNAEDKAYKEADKKYPLAKLDLTESDISKNADLRDSLKDQYEWEIAKENNLKKVILDSIGIEGLKKGWAFPNDLE